MIARGEAAWLRGGATSGAEVVGGEPSHQVLPDRRWLDGRGSDLRFAAGAPGRPKDGEGVGASPRRASGRPVIDRSSILAPGRAERG